MQQFLADADTNYGSFDARARGDAKHKFMLTDVQMDWVVDHLTNCNGQSVLIPSFPFPYFRFPFTAYCLLPAYCLLLTAYFLLLTTYYCIPTTTTNYYYLPLMPLRRQVCVWFWPSEPILRRL